MHCFCSWCKYYMSHGIKDQQEVTPTSRLVWNAISTTIQNLTALGVWWKRCPARRLMWFWLPMTSKPARKRGGCSERSFLAAHRPLTPHRLGVRTGVTFWYTVRREGSRGHPGPHLLLKKATPRGTQITNPCLTNHRAGEPTRALQEKPKDPGA